MKESLNNKVYSFSLLPSRAKDKPLHMVIPFLQKLCSIYLADIQDDVFQISENEYVEKQQIVSLLCPELGEPCNFCDRRTTDDNACARDGRSEDIAVPLSLRLYVDNVPRRLLSRLQYTWIATRFGSEVRL